MKIFIKLIWFCMLLSWCNTNAQTVTKQLYLSNPGQALDRIHPGLVSPIDMTTATSVELGSIGGRAAQAFGTPTDISNQFGDNSLTPDLAVFESGGTETLHTVFLSKAPSVSKRNIYYSTKTGAGSWSAPVLISDDGFNQDAHTYPSVAVDANNKAHVVYGHKSGSDSKFNIYYVTNASGSWSSPVRISNDGFGEDAESPELALDAAGKVYVAYVHKSSSDNKLNIYCVTNTSGSWSSPVRISNDGFNQDVGLNPAITIDGSDKAHVAYMHKSGSDSKKNIYYVTNASGSWSSAARISDDGFNQDALDNPSIGIDGNEKPHVVYTHKSSTDSKTNIYYTEKTGASWSTPENLSNDQDGSDSSNPDIVVESSGTLRVAFSNNGENIYYTENTDPGNSWITPVDINPLPAKSSDGNNPAVVVTSENVHAVYSDKHNTLSGDIDIFHNSAPLAGNGSTTFFQPLKFCSNFVMPNGGTVNVLLHTNLTGGTMPASPDINVVLEDNLGNPIITLNNPIYTPGSGSTGTLSWTGNLSGAVTVPLGRVFVLTIEPSVYTATFSIEYDSNVKPSKIELPTTTFINVDSIDIYDAAYPGGSIITDVLSGTTVYVRVLVSDPFGPNDISGTDITFTPPGGPVSATSVSSGFCTKTYEYAWTTPTPGGIIDIQATAKEGYENAVTDIQNISFQVFTPPTANDDIAMTPEDVPVDIDVINNDTDPENDIDSTSITVQSVPSNGSTSVHPVTGVITYTPDLNFVGTDQFTYQVCDDYGACDQAVVDINIPAVNDDPIATNDAFTVAYNTANQPLDVLNAGTPDYDVESHAITLTGVGTDAANGLTAQGGTVTINNNSTPGDPTDDFVEYTPAVDFVGFDSFQYEITDTFGGTGIATVTLTVLANIEISCSNGFDDDGDGLVDCADPDCTPVTPANFFRVGN